jgi:hypothetical protein
MMKRIGLAAIIVGVLVFGAESILALLRQRNIYVTVQAQESASAVSTPAATIEPATRSDPNANALSISPLGGVQLAVKWEYRIGPGFPITVVHAEALDSTQQVVAEDTFTIDCGAASLECNGEHLLSLYYHVRDAKGQRIPWPISDFLLHITRTYAGLNPVLILNQPFRVEPQQ